MRVDEAVFELKQIRDVYANMRKEYKSCVEALDTAINALETQKWIPCSERLPEESGLYIVTNVGRWVEPVGTRYYNIRADFNFWSGHQSDKVLAWMPLPAPYREEGDE